jgi:5'-3' exonuclease
VTGIKVHLVDGTYELFRYHFAPNNKDPDLGATRGVLGSLLQLLESGATHVGVATDHIIESFRNDLWPGYKTSAGMPPELLAQFPLIEEALDAAGILTWPMVELEADDALGAAARVAAADTRVEQVLICTPDKDLGQCVVGDRIVQFDRRKGEVRDAEGVRAKFGVPPESIPDYLGLVGDTADGFPGLPGWGAKSAGAVLGHYLHLEAIPPLAKDWAIDVRGAVKLATTLSDQREDADLFRLIATLRTDHPVGTVDEWRWSGPTPEFAEWTTRLGSPGMLTRAERLASARA